MTGNEIAEMLGVSRQRVSQLWKQSARYTKTPRGEALEHYPWKTGEKFHEASPNRRMRDHAEYMETGGKGMSDVKLERLASFYRMLQENDWVVEFDPSIPSSPGQFHGGFAYRNREDGDGDLIIRVNDHTTLTSKGRMLWRFPPRFPSV